MRKKRTEENYCLSKQSSSYLTGNWPNYKKSGQGQVAYGREKIRLCNRKETDSAESSSSLISNSIRVVN